MKDAQNGRISVSETGKLHMPKLSQEQHGCLVLCITAYWRNHDTRVLCS